jgi:hypothetical protein
MGFMGRFSLFGNSASKASKTSKAEAAPIDSHSSKSGTPQIAPIFSQIAPTFNAPEPVAGAAPDKTAAAELGSSSGSQVPLTSKAGSVGGNPLVAGSTVSPAENGGSDHATEKSPVDSMEADLTELLVAIKSQVDSERLRIAENRDSPERKRENQLYSGPVINGISAALNTFQKESRARTLSDDSQVDRLRVALIDVTQAMEALVTTLPDPSIGDGGWSAILAELKELSERQRRLDEIQKAFDATMKEVEEGFIRIEQHIQASILQEQGCIETLQKRIKMAEGLARLLKR